ncbi:hypothetical protein C8P64_0860 [Christiangramia gaetbulicola]|uniref:Uncharacterized protein n=1 Tax=Christiangramia gaetbulicola TaxID=703340 RepID=A0A2T6AM70_9FLAO|nr:hypothetical protein [Christiangramia gaetbulicola]PTX44877.1 hypothetical protein C8P64_0860 [Christiangramia gaetbulicola]
MRLFLRQIKLIDQSVTDINIISILFKFFLITAIALLVFVLTAKTYAPSPFKDGKKPVPEMLTANPPAPF